MALALSEYVGSVCEVRSMQNALMVIGLVTDIVDGEVVLTPARGQNLPILRYRTQVKATMMNRMTEEVMILIGTVFTSTDKQLHLTEMVTLENYERRNFFRVNAKADVRLKPIETDEVQGKQELMAAVLLDVSLGGCLLETRHGLLVGGHYSASFVLVQVAHEVELVIGRGSQQAEEPNNKLKRYGCTFQNNSERKMDAICKDLFVLQRRHIQSKRGGE